MTPREALIHAAFKGLAEGLMVAAEPIAAPPTPKRRAVKARRRGSQATVRNNQLPLSPEMAGTLQQQFVPVDARPPDGYEGERITVDQLDDLFRGGGNEAVDALARQMRMQTAAAQAEPPKKQPEEPAAAPVWGIPDL